MDEYTAIAECHRKHAICLLSGNAMGETTSSLTALKHARRIYDDAVRESLVVVWEAADRVCSKRLKALLPSLLAAMECHRHLALDAVVRERVLSMSAATINRLLAPVRATHSRWKKRKLATKAHS